MIDEALLLYSKIVKLKPPARRLGLAVRDWFIGTCTGSLLQFTSSSASIYKNLNNLVLLHPLAKEDPLSVFFA
jgi:hypothetical protein